MRSCHSGKGEALIVVVVLAGFFWLMSLGKFSVQDTWSYAGFLAMIVGFYFALLLCRMTFFHMVGGNGAYPWWLATEEHGKYWEAMKKGGKK